MFNKRAWEAIHAQDITYYGFVPFVFQFGRVENNQHKPKNGSLCYIIVIYTE